MSSLTLKEISQKLNTLISQFSQYYIGRERTIRLIVLALISKQHIYMVSPPGTGKTMMENVAKAFNFSYMYYLFNYDTKLEDILYNPIIKKESLGNSEKIIVDYELKKPGLGTVDVFFGDEMFKASTPVLNALLGAMNERRVTLGNREVKIPLWTMIAASNELPDAPALLDRFLYRDFLKYLPPENWLEYLIQYWNIHQPGFNRVVTTMPRTVIEEANKRLWQVDITPVLDDYAKLLLKLKDRNIEVSDRRKGRILQALAASAIIDGRDEVYPEDLEVLLYTVPTTEDEKETVAKTIDEFLGGLLTVKEELKNAQTMLKDILSNLSNYDENKLVDILTNELPKISNKLNKLNKLNFTSIQRLIEDTKRLVKEVQTQIIDKLAERLVQ